MGFDKWLSHDNFFELNPTLSRNGGPPQKYQGESSELIIAETIQFLKSAQQKKQPFFTVVWFGSPHEPYSGLDQDLALYDNLPVEYAQKEVRLTSNETGRPTKRPLRDVLRERYAEITAMDRSSGQLRDWLKKQKLRDNTILWYCGDNGTPGDGIVTSPFRGQKGICTKEGFGFRDSSNGPIECQNRESLMSILSPVTCYRRFVLSQEPTFRIVR